MLSPSPLSTTHLSYQIGSSSLPSTGVPYCPSVSLLSVRLVRSACCSHTCSSWCTSSLRCLTSISNSPTYERLCDSIILYSYVPRPLHTGTHHLYQTVSLGVQALDAVAVAELISSTSASELSTTRPDSKQSFAAVTFSAALQYKKPS